MANIHRISDFQNNQQNQSNNVQGQFSQFFQTPIVNNPLNENYCDMIRLTFFPQLRLKSVTTLIALIILIVYIVMVFKSLDDASSRILLSPSEDTLKIFGILNISQIFNHRYWILIASNFLCQNIITLFIVEFVILVVGNNIEQIVKTRATLLSYLLGGFTGAITLIVTSYYYETNTSVLQGVVGQIGSYGGFVILNWYQLELLGLNKYNMICQFLMIVVMLLFGSQNSQIYGNIIAMLTGIFVGLGIIEPYQNGEYEYKCRLAGIISTIFILMITVLLLLKET